MDKEARSNHECSVRIRHECMNLAVVFDGIDDDATLTELGIGLTIGLKAMKSNSRVHTGFIPPLPGGEDRSVGLYREEFHVGRVSRRAGGSSQRPGAILRSVGMVA